MDANDRNQLLNLLAESREALCAAAANLSDEQSRLRPVPDRWSVLECVEHVALVENGILTLITTSLTPCPPLPDRTREENILRNTTNRAIKFNAPERLQPKGRLASLAAALEQFQQNRARSIEYVEHCDKDMRAFSLPHPAFGPITAHEFLIILALHPARHANQIREVRQSLGFPA